MARATRIVGRGGWSGEPLDTLVLGYDERRRREGRLTGVRGAVIDLALEDALTMRGGDALALEGGGFVEIVSAPEMLAELRCKDGETLARCAWMIGNRHAPIQIAGSRIRLRDEEAAKAVAAALDLKLTLIEAPFDPEGGAYAPETIVETHEHGHACGCGHHHHHEHEHHAHGHHAHDHHAHEHHGHEHHEHEHHAHEHHGHEHHGHEHHEHGGCCGGRGHKRHHAHDHAHDHADGGCGCGGHAKG